MISTWKTLKRKIVFKHTRLSLVEDTVELPDGKTAEYLRHAPAVSHSVAVIAVNNKQEVLLQREYSYPPDTVMWQPPGGVINEGEEIFDAANRELSEESGYVAKNCSLLGFYYVNNRRSDERQYVVLCTDLNNKKSKADAEEFIESYWINPSKLRKMIADGGIENINLLAALNLWLHSLPDYQYIDKSSSLC